MCLTCSQTGTSLKYKNMAANVNCKYLTNVTEHIGQIAKSKH